MRPANVLGALPPEFRQQLLAMPLCPHELTEVAESLLRMDLPQKLPTTHQDSTKNAPQPDRLRGV